MDSVTLLENSPPGYFDGSEEQTEATQKIFDWFTRYKDSVIANANNFDNFYRLFLSLTYTANTDKTWLLINLERYGIRNISLSAENLKKLLIWVSTPKKKKLSDNIQDFVNFLFDIEWITDFDNVKVGYTSPAKYAENFIIFSNSVSLPSTPSSQEYFPRTWLAPTGWTKTPLSSTYYARGYLYEGQIVWSTPRSTANAILYSAVSNLASLPGSPTTYDIAIVTDDGTTDFQAVYYYDGTQWRKNSSPNQYQGEVGIDNAYDSSLVYAPEETDLISSDTQPPEANTEGYGFYGIWGLGTITKFIIFSLTLTDEGNRNLGLIIQLMKKFKPLGSIIFYVNIIYEETERQILIKDYNAI